MARESATVWPGGSAKPPLTGWPGGSAKPPLTGWQDRSVRVAGVDGRRGGWVVAVVDLEPAPSLVSLQYVAPLAPALADDLAAIAIDMPIGLSDSGPRECDIAARRLLRPHSSRVFPAPPRAALAHADDYAAACEAARALTGRALSKQTWHLLPAIAEVDALADDGRIAECHPEIAFALMQGHPVDERKKTAEGRAVRLDLLGRWLPDLGDPAYGDDGLDAIACAWSAARIAAGTAIALPAGAPPRDADGRPMRISA
jgi:predicted RNase H-like nuclease